MLWDQDRCYIRLKTIVSAPGHTLNATAALKPKLAWTPGLDSVHGTGIRERGKILGVVPIPLQKFKAERDFVRSLGPAPY